MSDKLDNAIEECNNALGEDFIRSPISKRGSLCLTVDLLRWLIELKQLREERGVLERRSVTQFKDLTEIIGDLYEEKAELEANQNQRAIEALEEVYNQLGAEDNELSTCEIIHAKIKQLKESK